MLKHEIGAPADWMAEAFGGIESRIAAFEPRHLIQGLAVIAAIRRAPRSRNRHAPSVRTA